MSDPLLGTRVLQRYRVVQQLAVGGMGVIYLGRSEGAAGFAKPVVIKRMTAEFGASDENAVELFVREASILSELRHPRIVSVLDFGEDRGAYTMALEYVHGFHLGQWAALFRKEREEFPADLAIHVVCTVLEALDYAHTLKRSDGTIVRVIHRDLTPSNVLVDENGQLKLADFGIARIVRSDDDRTKSGVLRGKMSYVAPEMLHGHQATVASDVYSVGLMLHELLVGHNQFRGSSPAETLRLVLHAEPIGVEALRRDVPSGIDALLARVLSKSPKERPANALEFQEALAALQEETTDSLQRKLESRIKRDFERLPRVLGVDPLSERDAAWREAPTSESFEVPRFVSRPKLRLAEAESTDRTRPARRVVAGAQSSVTLLSESSASTEPETPAPFEGPTSTPRPRNTGPRRIVLGTAGVLATVALLVVGLGSFERSRAASPQYVVVESTSNRADDAPAASSQGAHESLPSDAETSPDDDRAGARRTSSGQSIDSEAELLRRLSGRVASRRREIRQCLESARSTESAHLRFHVRIGADGATTSVAVDPETFATTDAGRCATSVMRAIDFGPMERPTTFTVPISVESVPAVRR